MSKRGLKEKREGVTRKNVYVEALKKSGLGPASLVGFHASSLDKNFIATYLADRLSPLLGDKFYSYRAKPLMGVMTKVGIQRCPVTSTQVRV